jgi:hypothetical protein
VNIRVLKILSEMERGMRINSWNGMKVVESLWNGMIENHYGMEWDSNFQDFGPLMNVLNLLVISIRLIKFY